MNYDQDIQRAIDAQIQLERNAARYLKLRAALCVPQGEAVELSLDADPPDQFDALVDTLPDAR